MQSQNNSNSFDNTSRYLFSLSNLPVIPKINIFASIEGQLSWAVPESKTPQAINQNYFSLLAYKPGDGNSQCFTADIFSNMKPTQMPNLNDIKEFDGDEFNQSLLNFESGKWEASTLNNFPTVILSAFTIYMRAHAWKHSQKLLTFCDIFVGKQNRSKYIVHGKAEVILFFALPDEMFLKFFETGKTLTNDEVLSCRKIFTQDFRAFFDIPEYNIFINDHFKHENTIAFMTKCKYYIRKILVGTDYTPFLKDNDIGDDKKEFKTKFLRVTQKYEKIERRYINNLMLNGQDMEYSGEINQMFEEPLYRELFKLNKPIPVIPIKKPSPKPINNRATQILHPGQTVDEIFALLKH